MYSKNLLISLFISVLLLSSGISRAVEVTFRVDMSEQTVPPEGVHIAGSFQGWDPGATEMTLTQDNIYAVTIDLTAGEYIEYKFVNGDEWGEDESVPAGCAQNNNRYLTVPDQATELDAVCFGSCTICNPPLVAITFQVDMSNETVSPNGVHVAGSFQGWDPATTEMLPVGDDIYSVTLELEAGNYYEYKYINGNAWGGDETVPPECAIGWNRYINVPFVPTTLDPVCFGSCYPCGPPPVDINVTLKVDMSEQVISPDGVHIAGGFQGWDPGATLMTDAGNNIYTYTAVMPSGTYQEYKFINGNTWEQSENVPPECSINNNRYLTAPWNDTIIEAVCYGACGPCGPPPVDVEVTFRVDMSDEIISPNGVHVAGTFQGWNATANPMADIGDNIYETTVTLSSGEYHEFKYINGDSFDFVEAVPEECGVPDGQGGFNRFFTVPQQDTTFTAVCFGSCQPCPPPQPEHTVTFQVDMTYETVSPDGVHLAGTFQGWDPAATEMTPVGDNIYQITLLLEEGDDHEFKYINGNTFDDAEIVPGICAVNGNRFFTVPAGDTTMTAVCFGSCDPCGPPPTDVDVTFVVDMAYEDVSADGVHVAGSFQGWDPEATMLTNIEEAKYAVTVTLTSGEYYEYKFINGNTFGEAEAVPEECGVPDGFGGFSRYITAPENDTTLVAACFGECDTCGPPPVEVNVTFRVDMANEEVSADGVHIAGDFQGWDPGATEMTIQEAQVYYYTTTLLSGDMVEYKFINGNEWGDDETVPAECAQNNNRYLEVPAMDTVLLDVCFGSCDTCVIIGLTEQKPAADVLGFYPNPTSGLLYFAPMHALLEVRIYAVDGKLLVNKKTDAGMLDLSSLQNGLYFIRIESEEKSRYGKLIIK